MGWFSRTYSRARSMEVVAMWGAHVCRCGNRAPPSEGKYCIVRLTGSRSTLQHLTLQTKHYTRRCKPYTNKLASSLNRDEMRVKIIQQPLILCFEIDAEAFLATKSHYLELRWRIKQVKNLFLQPHPKCSFTIVNHLVKQLFSVLGLKKYFSLATPYFFADWQTGNNWLIVSLDQAYQY